MAKKKTAHKKTAKKKPSKPSKKTATYRLPKHALRALLSIAAKEGRPVISALHVRGRKLYATDGQRMLRITGAWEEAHSAPGRDVTLRREELDLVLRMMKAGDSVRIQIPAKGSVTARVGPASVELEETGLDFPDVEHDGMWPEWRNPEICDGVPVMTLDARYLDTVRMLTKGFSRSSAHTVAICVPKKRPSADAGMDCVVAFQVEGERLTWDYLVMPVRV